MFGKLIAQFVGSAEKDSDVAVETDNCANLFEFEDGDWVIIKINKNQSLGSAEADILENLLIEHPSMSVYQMRPEEDLSSDEEVEDMARPVPLRRHVSWQLAAWGSPLPCSTILLSVQRARVYNEHRKMTRGALNRQNLTQTRFSPSDRRYGYFKQPTQRLYNY
ncbi:tumor protein p53-inducible nuclear protein 2-like [Myxocyprinus asiaticus]|uniref:tumor protein p53-inducible nuclear protein 2-like n=1 Tax=Myxocyprinus asiaticus TaxID=70543 RepID=UPI002221BDA3|nr:tumor protein p53-inducible nuclear protein 2-like [Myxocyprinus asiaticus]XP_051501079.1 tumor protein p53-inducible nuclear protein 2-like [Myxocyprinus asiaticus]